MMCLGWSTKPMCQTRPDVIVAGGGPMAVSPVQGTPTGSGSGSGCGAEWFWLGLAALGLVAMTKGN